MMRTEYMYIADIANQNMLWLLLWISGTLLVFGTCLFVGKKKGEKVSSEDRLTVNIRNYCAIALIMCIIMFSWNYPRQDGFTVYVSLEASIDTAEMIRRLLSWMREQFFGNNDTGRLFSMSIYAELVMSSVFLFFTGMRVHSGDIRIRRKGLLLIPLILLLVPTFSRINFLNGHNKKIKIWGLIRYVFAESIYTCSKYLLGMAVTAAILVAVYILLKKILRSELIPILVVLVLSCFPPAIYATRGITNPQLYYLYLGTNMPLLPLGILVGKYRSILIPKKRSLRILYVSVWSALAVLSYATLWLLQPVVLAVNGMQYRYSTSFCATPAVPNNQRINNFLEPYTKAQCITWLLFGLSVVMLLLIFATMINTDNRLTSFFREHIPEILILSYSIFFIKFTLARARDPWYDRFPGRLVVGSSVELGIAIAGAVVLRKLLGADKRQ